MTLITGMAKAEGIYLSADYRVTEHPSGKLVASFSIASRWALSARVAASIRGS